METLMYPVEPLNNWALYHISIFPLSKIRCLRSYKQHSLKSEKENTVTVRWIKWTRHITSTYSKTHINWRAQERWRCSQLHFLATGNSRKRILQPLLLNCQYELVYAPDLIQIHTGEKKNGIFEQYWLYRPKSFNSQP